MRPDLLQAVRASRTGDAILEIGAGLGECSLSAAALARGARFLVVEAEAAQAAAIAASVARNAWTHVTVTESACACSWYTSR